ncbi:uncharacterized protein L201_001319 [Kwoniella dendrophila CBS 6074]|uniref:Fibronectin type-III domain-containing protein n=1 Tax=Kwoniella dendrophila CBS 6074 TaxID=1295534 RepID=A0AAX4JNP1_9TREE
MLFCKSLFAILAIVPASFTFASPLTVRQGTPASSGKGEIVKFTNEFPSTWQPGQTVNLSWQGGSGDYALYEIYYAPNQGSSRPGYLLTNTTETSTTVALYSTVSPGETLTFGVAEAGNSGIYDLSDTIPFCEC